MFNEDDSLGHNLSYELVLRVIITTTLVTSVFSVYMGMIYL